MALVAVAIEITVVAVVVLVLVLVVLYMIATTVSPPLLRHHRRTVNTKHVRGTNSPCLLVVVMAAGRGESAKDVLNKRLVVKKQCVEALSGNHTCCCAVLVRGVSVWSKEAHRLVSGLSGIGGMARAMGRMHGWMDGWIDG
jgi:hypothetical protein